MDVFDAIIDFILQGETEFTLVVQLRFFFMVFALEGIFSIVRQIINMCRRL